jgi:hypothetical protein
VDVQLDYNPLVGSFFDYPRRFRRKSVQLLTYRLRDGRDKSERIQIEIVAQDLGELFRRDQTL